MGYTRKIDSTKRRVCLVFDNGDIIRYATEVANAINESWDKRLIRVETFRKLKNSRYMCATTELLQLCEFFRRLRYANNNCAEYVRNSVQIFGSTK